MGSDGGVELSLALVGRKNCVILRESIAWLCFELLALLCLALLTSSGKSNQSSKNSSRRCRRVRELLDGQRRRCRAFLGFGLKERLCDSSGSLGWAATEV